MSEKYDVVIIGAGIGGLVCGCYLAKAGLKVLIVEKNDKPGGYCSSFERDGYRFDVGVRYLGGVKRGVLGKILKELDLKDEIKFNQFDPTDKIMMPDNVVYIRANPYDTIEEFKKSFSKEKNNIERFFKFIMQRDFLRVYKKIRKVTFKDVLRDFFEDYKIMQTLSGIIFIKTGLDASRISAVVASILFRSYILDPGYYPLGGIQTFPNVLVNRFKKWDGEILFSTKVTRILTEKRKIVGISFKRKMIKSKIIVSNIDASYLFNRLLTLPCRERNIIKYLIPSPSAFVVYVGLDASIKERFKETCGVIYFSSYNIEEILLSWERHNFIEKINGIICEFSSFHDPLTASSQNYAGGFATLVPYKSKVFWNNFKEKIVERIINKVEKILFPIRRYLKFKLIATPLTFYKYTLNKKGALFGWASTLNQIKISILPPKTSLEGLYLAGHWCTVGFGQGGVSGVALSGRRTAEWVLREMRKEWRYKLIKP